MARHARVTGRLVVVMALTVSGLALPVRAASADQAPLVQTAARGLEDAVEAGRIAPTDAARYRAILQRTAFALPRLRGGRATNLRAVLSDIANAANRYTATRALTLFSMLDVNARYFGANEPPAAKSDVLGPDEIVYRYFPGHGLQFHPLGNFGALNAHLAAQRLGAARALCDALKARAVDRGDGSMVWEYAFRYAGGAPPWTSGMAQAVAAQSLARASEKLEDASQVS